MDTSTSRYFLCWIVLWINLRVSFTILSQRYLRTNEKQKPLAFKAIFFLYFKRTALPQSQFTISLFQTNSFTSVPVHNFFISDEQLYLSPSSQFLYFRRTALPQSQFTISLFLMNSFTSIPLDNLVRGNRSARLSVPCSAFKPHATDCRLK